MSLLLIVILAVVSGCEKISSALGREPRRQPLVYVTNEDSNDISVIDVGSDRVVATIPVGKRPRGVRVDSSGAYVYVAVSGAPKSGPGVPPSPLPPDPAADGIAVVDAKRRALERRLPSGRDPEAFALHDERKLLLVSNEETAQASVVALGGGGLVRTIPVGGEPEGVELRPDGRVAYVTSEADREVAVIGIPELERIAVFKTEARPRGVAFTPDGRRAFVTDEGGAAVTVVDAWAHLPLTTIRLDEPRKEGAVPRPMGIVVAPDGRLAYVTTGRAGGVVVIDVERQEVAQVIDDVGSRPWGIGITADGAKLYVANGPSNDVAVIDTRTRRVVRRVNVGRSPWGIALDRGT